jgi:hypothetical protein
MIGALSEIGGMRVLLVTADGPPLLKASDADVFMSAAWSQNAAMVAIPAPLLGDDFFHLSTLFAGNVFQKFANYRLRLSIFGDISKWTSNSKALRDLVFESNSGSLIWFVRDIDELTRRVTSSPRA